MKKTLLAVALGALAVAGTANANWYAQGDLGVSKTKYTSYSELNKTRVEPRVSVGYDFGNVRVAADYTHHGKASANGLEAKVHGIGVSAIYDINTDLAFTPYVGVRLSSNLFRVKERGQGFLVERNETKFGYGAVAGVQYPLAEKVSLNGGVEYNRLGSFEDTKVNNYGAKVGVRYDF